MDFDPQTEAEKSKGDIASGWLARLMTDRVACSSGFVKSKKVRIPDISQFYSAEAPVQTGLPKG